MLVIGPKEVEQNLVAVRSRENGDIGTMNIDEFENKILNEIEEKK